MISLSPLCPVVKITNTSFCPDGNSMYAASFRAVLVHPAFDHNFETILGHHAKESITIDDPKCFQAFVNRGERSRPFCVRLKGSENEPDINR